MLSSLTCGQENVYVAAWSPLAPVSGGSFDEEIFSFWDFVVFEVNTIWKGERLVILTDNILFSRKTQSN